MFRLYEEREFGHALVPTLQKLPDFESPIQPRSVFPDGDLPPTRFGLGEQEDRRCAIALVFVVDARRATCGTGNRLMDLLDQLNGLLVHADHRRRRIVGTL